MQQAQCGGVRPLLQLCYSTVSLASLFFIGILDADQQ